MSNIAGQRAVVVGASRGFGRGIAEALVDAGAEVHAVARGDASELVHATGGRARPIAADATDPEVAERVLRDVAPTIVVLNAGATPTPAPLSQHTWASFSTNWDTDVKLTFHWIRAVLERPLARGSVIVAMSSGAALRGSPLSGGYAGAKATIRFLVDYANGDAARAELGIRFVALLPAITPEGGVGRPFVDAYARRQGRTVEAFLGGPALTPATIGRAVVQIATERDLAGHAAFRVDSAGLAALAD